MSTLNSSVVSCGAFRMRLFPLLVLALAQRALSQPSHSEQYELDAQKALADTLHDAMAMLRHGSASAKENAAEQIAELAVETTISQPFHPVTFRNAAVKAGIVYELGQSSHSTLLPAPLPHV